MPNFDDDDRDPTPAVPVVPYSELRLRLVELTAALNSVFHSLHEAGRKIDLVEGVGRQAMCAELADHFHLLRDEFLEVEAALREEAAVPGVRVPD
jgi:hypothetical protein